MAGAFSGLRFLDLSRLLPGPYCSLLFADLGAEVIKVEEPGRGDYARRTPPFWGDSDVGAYFLLLNRNKKSMSIDLKAEAGKAVFRRLVRTADVLLESFRPGVMDRLGLGWEALRAENPRLVYCAISGYGQDGPYRNLVGHDVNYMGYAGALSVTGPRDGAPLTPGVQVADLGGGALMAAFAIGAALHHRHESGQGQFVDVSMTDGVVSWLIPHLAAYFATGRVPERGAGAAERRLALLRRLRDRGRRPRDARGARAAVLGELLPARRPRGSPGRSSTPRAPDRDRVEAELRELFRTRTRAPSGSSSSSRPMSARARCSAGRGRPGPPARPARPLHRGRASEAGTGPPDRVPGPDVRHARARDERRRRSWASTPTRSARPRLRRGRDRGPPAGRRGRVSATADRPCAGRVTDGRDSSTGCSPATAGRWHG